MMETKPINLLSSLDVCFNLKITSYALLYVVVDTMVHK